MTTNAEHILSQAMSLEESERVELAERLWDSVEPSRVGEDLSDEQKATLDRRWEEITSGKVKCRRVDEVIADLRGKYGL